MTTEESKFVTRRSFCRTLALPAGVLLLGSALPAWAKSKNKKQEEKKPSDSTPPDSAEQRYETKVIWESENVYAKAFNSKTNVRAYNNHAYMVVVLPDKQVMILNAPFDGGEAKLSPLHYTAGSDPHRYYEIGVDSLGYIHVVGDMHGSAHVKHWVSKKPEDTSEFVFTSDLGADKRPGGYKVTYPHLFSSPDGVLYHSIRCGLPAYGIGISVLDAKTQTWSMLGAEVPAQELLAVPSSHAMKHANGAKGKPMTAWEDNGAGGYFQYMQPHAKMVWDKNKRMHLAVALLSRLLKICLLTAVVF